MRKPIELSMPHTDQWHADRRTGWGASELAKLANLSIYGSAFESVQRKLGRLPDIEETLPMRRGTAVEPMIVVEACEQLGRSASRYPCPLFRSETHPFLLATPDAMLDEHEGIECKKTNWRIASQLGDDGTEFENSGDHVSDWVCQAQGQMAVMGWSRVWVAVLIDLESPVKLFPVERNQCLIDSLTVIAKEMWDRVLNDDPPEPAWNHPSTRDVLKEIHRTIDPGKVVTLSDDAIAAVARRTAINAEKKVLDTEYEGLTAKILSELGDANAGDLRDGYVMRRKVISKASYVVSASSYTDMRRVKMKTFMEEPTITVGTTLPTPVNVARRDSIAVRLEALGYRLKDESPAGSRYYCALGKPDVRLADHAPNYATESWMAREGVKEIRFDGNDFEVRDAFELIALI